VHGGSMRYVIAHKGARPVTAAVAAQRAKETALGLDDASTYDRLSARIERSRPDLMALLKNLKRQGKRVVGYAATSKSTTVTNYCGIAPELVEFISDTTPIKQGKFSPGVHIPVRPYDEFKARYPDYALLFGWNHAEEIMDKEQAFRAAGGKWIMYVPEVQVVP
jgi:methylation protein EvaC